MKKDLDPIDRDIVRVLSKANMRHTPSKIAKTINVHPATAKRRIEVLSRKKILDCKKNGNRLMCKIREKNGK